MGGAVLKPSGKDVALQCKIDRCGYLLAVEREAKPWRDELAALKSDLQAQCDDQPGKSVRLKGRIYYVDLGPREWRREVSDKAKCFAILKRALGIETLLKRLPAPPFKVIDTAIPKEQQAAFVEKERTGPRPITAGLIKSPLAAA